MCSVRVNGLSSFVIIRTAESGRCANRALPAPIPTPRRWPNHCRLRLVSACHSERPGSGFHLQVLTPSLCNQIGEDPTVDLICLPHGRVAQLPKSELEVVGRAAKRGVVIDVSRSDVRCKVCHDTGKTTGSPSINRHRIAYPRSGTGTCCLPDVYAPITRLCVCALTYTESH